MRDGQPECKEPNCSFCRDAKMVLYRHNGTAIKAGDVVINENAEWGLCPACNGSIDKEELELLRLQVMNLENELTEVVKQNEELTQKLQQVNLAMADLLLRTEKEEKEDRPRRAL